MKIHVKGANLMYGNNRTQNGPIILFYVAFKSVADSRPLLPVSTSKVTF